MSQRKVPTQEQQSARLMVMLVAAGLATMVLSGTIVGFLLVAGGAEEPEAPTPAMVRPTPEPMKEARATPPQPAPIAPTEGGYGRPEPLAIGGDDSEEPPLHIRGGPDTLVDRVEIGGPEPSATVGSTTVGAPDKGGLPGRWGNPYAPVTMVVFNDFECPFCSKLEGTFAQIHERYPTQVELHFRDFPLEFHKNAHGAHQAARCAHEQGRFWAMHDTLFAKQRALTYEDLLAHASSLGLDMSSFDRCLASERTAGAVDADIAAGKAAGVTGTPTTFVNGTELRGAQAFDKFVAAIEAEL